MEVDIDKILPLTEARDNFNKIIDDVGGTDHMYVLTKNGKPSAVVVGVNHLEKLTGKNADELTSMVEKKADTTPVVEEVNPSVPLSGASAGGSKPLATDVAVTGQSIQPGVAPATSPPLEVPVVSPTESSPAPDGGQAVPTSSTQRVPSDLGPGSVATSAPIEAPKGPPRDIGTPEVASNQAPAPPNPPPTGGAAASDSDLFV